MADLSDTRRARADLERQKTTISARLIAEERTLAEASRTADARSSAAAENRLKALRIQQAAAAANLRANETRMATLLTEATTTPPPAPSTGAAAPDLLGPVPSEVPLLLLPVRLEVRFQGAPPARELLVRVYPDDIHIDTHEPALTSDEREAGKRYWKQAWRKNDDADQAAWNQLAGLFGAERAAWIARTLTPTNLARRPGSAPAFPQVDERPSSWSRAPWATMLPDRWIALGYGPGGRLFAVTGEPIPDRLQVGPEPEADDTRPAKPNAVPLGDGARWLIDFEAAVKTGMAFRIALPAAAQNGLSRLVVVGVKRSLGVAESGAAVAALLDAQHFTRGVACIPPGTPTNNTTDTASGLDSRDTGHERSYAHERSGPLFDTDEQADGAIAAHALGLPPAPFQHLAHAGENHLHAARSMNAALWSATWGYYLEQRLAGVVSDAELRQVRRHFVNFVRAGGPLPALRIGRQPYGFLPVTSLDRWRGADADDANARALGALREVREAFRRAVGNVPRMHNAATSEQDLLSVLRQRPSSRGHQMRHIFGPMYVSNYFAFAGTALPPNWWAAHRSIVNAPNLGGITPTMPQSLASLAPLPEAITNAPRVAATDAKPEYLNKLAVRGWRAALNHEDAPPAPWPMLYRITRHALLLAYNEAAHRLARRGGGPTGGPLEPEFIGIDPNTPSETFEQRLARPVPGAAGEQTIGAFLDDAAHEKDAEVAELSEVRIALRELAQVPVADLERLLVETLDLATHRFDAWATSLASRRIASLRKRQPEGVQCGGYGWLEDLRPTDAAISNGFVQVPSLDHAATAAVLASGYLSHRNQTGPSPFAINLSSDRVRNARWLLQGVRAGQTLGALLGYRIERGLYEANLMDRQDDLRVDFALDAGLDGAKVLEAHRADRNRFGPMKSVLDAVDQELDALGDLLIAEGVFQATRGNFDRAGQTLGAVMNGQSLPEPEVMDTPRTGVVLSHRVIKFFKSTGPAPRGALATPRAVAEPRINRWVGELLGDLTHVRCRVEYRSTELTVARELALAELALAPLDLVATSDDNLEGLLVAQARLKRPPRVPATAEVRLVREPDPTWKRDVIGWREFLFFLAAARKLLAALRPLAGADLNVAHQRDTSSPDVVELRTRADAAVAKLKKVASLKSPTNALAGFGIFGTPLAAVTEARDRLAKVQSADRVFARAGATPAQAVTHDAERIRLVFGAAFPVLPLVKAGNAAELQRAFAASDRLQDGDPLASTAWLERVAHVRPPIAQFQEVTRFTAALHGTDEACAVAQVPLADGDRWVALPARPGAMPTGKLSLVTHGTAPDFKTALCGVVIDEWTEIVPNARETTGLVFQFDRPAARPPQACLLAAAPDPSQPWSLDTLEATVLEALELTQLRLVDQDALTELDHFLPALCFALNATDDTVATDFR